MRRSALPRGSSRTAFWSARSARFRNSPVARTGRPALLGLAVWVVIGPPAVLKAADVELLVHGIESGVD